MGSIVAESEGADPMQRSYRFSKSTDLVSLKSRATRETFDLIAKNAHLFKGCVIHILPEDVKGSLTKSRGRRSLHNNYSDAIRISQAVDLKWRNLNLATNKLESTRLKAKLAAFNGTLIEETCSKGYAKKVIHSLTCTIFENERTRAAGNNISKQFLKKPQEAFPLAQRLIPYEMTQILTGHSRLLCFQYKLWNVPNPVCNTANLSHRFTWLKINE